ncbi:Putative beta-lactamase HcpC precursor [Piscirickettsia salmonis]|uniref:Sel1 repeat-containing protein n=1 Tax=Piscirickettsia salmonis TaxID=1238 RepID=A0A9Q6LNF9_PISSA|nr:sel1 repeat family protein [Piscirickettsia salmonis]ALA25876.1 sel1 repeat family protein [Piscirickettsia salmonis]QGN78318.1 Sel1 repeat-containing protein [Piscirickettsia salmonis]QGN81901.1 Putative beta-lactamase HcpC precursor [Piscirickettsia salmonis]QGN83828.1 Putative beta-lactamase HcpC precursor [Piscirickettsia salmonis]QGN87340.1 Putative beta-lactamase HcpC precursor [Piscirickettsia salmonis]
MIRRLGISLEKSAAPRGFNSLLRLTVLFLIIALSAPGFAADFITANHEFQAGQFKQAFEDSIPFAQAGNLQACLEVGFMYEFGKGAKQDAKAAAQWYLSAVRPNAFNARALERGWAYYKGTGVTQSDTKAAEWFRMAAELSQGRY